MINVGIVGGAGYTAGELIRLLVNHPQVQIKFIHSKSQGGKAIWEVHRDLLGDIDTPFSSEFKPQASEIDALFMCVGHGEAQKFLSENPIPENIKIIDLSQDFRLERPETQDKNFIYGLPELNRSKIQEATRIANPGCFATCIQLTLLPLASQGLLNKDVHIQAITGSTGAGQSLRATTHFSWRNNNVSVYKAFTHQHLGEIRQSLKSLQPDFESDLNFIPMRGNFTRGILASVYTYLDLSEVETYELYQSYYQSHPFIRVSSENPDLKQVVNTNKALLHIVKHQDKLLIIGAIDNLLKGASGQALQNMNLMFGLEETSGLKLKASYF